MYLCIRKPNTYFFMIRKILFTLSFSALCVSLFAENPHKSTNMGSEVDVYIEYSPIQEITLFVGEELSLSNFLIPNSNLFDYSLTSIGVTYTPHRNISLTAAYDFQYAFGNEITHTAKLMITPEVSFGDFTLSLCERFEMNYSMSEQTPAWLLRSKLQLDYSIPETPLTPYLYIEMYNPLEANPPHWYETLAYGAGLDWDISEHHTIGIYYEFSHSIDSYYHLLGVAYTLGL